MDPILPFSEKWAEATVKSRVKPKRIIALQYPAVFANAPKLATAIAESTIYPKPESNAAKFFKGQQLESNAAAVFARPPLNSNNRPPTNTELAQIRAEAEAREAAKRAELERQRQTQQRRRDLIGMQRGFRQTSVFPIGQIRPQSPGNKKDGGKRKTLRKYKGKKVKKTNKRRH
jgi:hypothetical protein